MSATTELFSVKARMKATWEAGDYATFATYMEPGVVDFFGRHFGPIVRANQALDDGQRQALRQDLVQVFERFNRGTNGTTLMEGEFLSVQAVA